MQIQERLLNILFNAVLSNVRKGRFLIDGIERDIDIFRTEQLGNIIRVMFYLDDYSGAVTQAALLDSDNAILVSGNTNFYKQDDGFIYAFDIPIVVEGTVPE